MATVAKVKNNKKKVCGGECFWRSKRGGGVAGRREVDPAGSVNEFCLS